jgi:hypothetical protein
VKNKNKKEKQRKKKKLELVSLSLSVSPFPSGSLIFFPSLTRGFLLSSDYTRAEKWREEERSFSLSLSFATIKIKSFPSQGQ